MPTNLTPEEVQALWDQYDQDEEAYVTALELRQDILEENVAYLQARLRGENPNAPRPIPQRPFRPTRPVPPRPSVG